MTHAPVTIFDDYIAVCVAPETLTDGSKVYNVTIGSKVIHATSKDAAIMLANTIADAINDMSVDEAQAMIRKDV